MIEINMNLEVKKITAFLFGLLSCTNCVYLFTVGNTPIMAIEVLGVLTCMLYCFSNVKLFQGVYKLLPSSLTIFILGCILSVFSVIINISYFYQWLVGIISLFLQVFIIISVILLKDEKRFLVYGLATGIFINVIIVLIAWLFYLRGINFLFSNLFPKVNAGIPYLGNAYAVRGMFKEQGHLMRFMAISFFIILFEFRKKHSSYLFLSLLISFIMMIFTRSAVLLYFVIGFAVYWIILNYRKPRLIFPTIVIILFAVLLIYLLRGKVSFIDVAINSFVEGFTDIGNDSIGSGNSIRLQGMRYTIEIIKDYPIIGCGWNLLTKMFMKYGFYGADNVVGSYSGLLSLIATIGCWTIFYVYFILSSSYKSLRSKTNLLEIGISLLVYLVIFSSTDYILDGGVSMLLGFSISLINKKSSLQKGIHFNDYNKNSF